MEGEEEVEVSLKGQIERAHFGLIVVNQADMGTLLMFGSIRESSSVDLRQVSRSELVLHSYLMQRFSGESAAQHVVVGLTSSLISGLHTLRQYCSTDLCYWTRLQRDGESVQVEMGWE